MSGIFFRYTSTGIYAVGMIAPVSRLWEGKHWLTDVGLSMALSVAVVDGIDNYLKKEKNILTQTRIKFVGI